MMKKNFLTVGLLAVVALFFVSCSSNDNGVNPKEAEILGAEVSGLDQPEINDTDHTIVFRLSEAEDDYNFAPTFDLSEEATIEPASGTERDFSQPQQYTVTSSDGTVSQTYTVKFIVDDGTNYNFTFENVIQDPDNNFDIFTKEDGSDDHDWSSGNPGFAITLLIQGKEKIPSNYPTYQSDTLGFDGNYAKLVTKTTGSLGASFGAPMAAGNLFIGDFAEVVPGDPRQGVHFGRPYNAKSAPVALKGHFKYKSGVDGVEVNNPENSEFEDGDVDRWDAYAILFKKSDEDNYLRGDHNFKDDKIVGVARIDAADAVEADDWTDFDIPFELLEGQKFDLNAHYMYTIVFAASVEGDLFNGAVGSTLEVDDVQLVTEADLENE